MIKIKVEKAISKNLNSLRKLIKESENLAEIISDMEEDSDKKLKEKLQTLRQNILCSIDELITNTEDLFKLYKDI